MKDIDGNEHTGYFEPDYFSQEMILDYVDGRLSKVDKALFEQHMQQDETLLLAVEGIRGFYIEEQKDRYDLEALMTHSETALKETMVQAAIAPKVVDLAHRKRWFGIAAAACVAILMVISLPQLFKKAGTSQGSISLKDEKGHVDKKGGTSSASSEGVSPNIVNPDAKGGETVSIGKNGDQSMLESDLNEMQKKAHKKTLGATDLMDEERNVTTQNTILDKVKETGKITKKNTQEEALFGKQPLPSEENTRNNAAKKTHAVAGSTDPTIAKGKLHLWVFANQSNTEYAQLTQMGKEIQATTGLQLEAQKLKVQQYNATQLQQMMRSQKVASNDVVWVHYLGKENAQNFQAKANSRGGGYAQSPVSNASMAQNVNTVLGSSKASLKILTVDQGAPVLNIDRLLKDETILSKDDDEYKKRYSAKKAAGARKTSPKPSNRAAYKKLFLGTKGMVTNVSVKSSAVRDNYQGVYTNQLLLNIQKVQNTKPKKINWNSLLRKAEKDAKKGNRKVKRNLRKRKYRR
ncbi:hypothetical protein BKI52_34155 [marine bacterium AO1-C]|nr:hypothetical protein BKI52_34155 [marine bacterium AO1-C]